MPPLSSSMIVSSSLASLSEVFSFGASEVDSDVMLEVRDDLAWVEIQEENRAAVVVTDRTEVDCFEKLP